MQSVCYFYLLLYHSPVHSFVFLLLLLLLILLLLLLLLIAIVCIVFCSHWPRNIVCSNFHDCHFRSTVLPERCRNDVQLDDVRRDVNSSTDGLRDEGLQSGWHRF